MNHAAKEQEATEAGFAPEEIPALLVAGGSCSHLCRAQRALPEEAGPAEPRTDSRRSPSIDSEREEEIAPLKENT